jgi:DNA modification methylase
MCGDSTSIDAVERLMDGRKADMVFTDPPYGISVVGGAKARNGSIGGAKARNGSIGGAGKVKAGEYRAVIGDDEDYNPSHIFACFPNAKYILWGANYYSDKLPIGGRWFVWDKNRGEGTTFSDCELAWSNIKGIVVKKYKVTWDGMNREGESGKRVHPTQKPVLLSEKILTDFHHEKQIVDLFGGSGSTLIACEKTASNCFMMELDPKYCDVIVKRWQAFTGQTATLEGNGQTFAELEAERCKAA